MRDDGGRVDDVMEGEVMAPTSSGEDGEQEVGE